MFNKESLNKLFVLAIGLLNGGLIIAAQHAHHSIEPGVALN